MTNVEHKTVTASTYFSVMLLFSNSVNSAFVWGLIITVFGSTFPDWDLRIFGESGSPEGYIGVYGHRGIMHYYKSYLIAYLFILIGFFVANLAGQFSPLQFFLATCFILAGFAHILEDSVTTAGVPIYRADAEYNQSAWTAWTDKKGKKYKKKKTGVKVYKSFSFHVGNFDSASVSYLAWGIVIINILLSVYLVHMKNINVSLWGWRHA